MSAALCLSAPTPPAPPAAKPRLRLVPAEASIRAHLGAELPSLRRYACKLCQNSADADDLVGDTVERALRFQHSFEPDTNARAWLNRIMYSVFISGFRRRGVERRALARFEHEPPFARAPAPGSRLGLLSGFDALVRRLPPSFAEVLLLVDVHECSYREAAEKLQIPIGTVMSRVHRARRGLQQALDDCTATAR